MPIIKKLNQWYSEDRAADYQLPRKGDVNNAGIGFILSKFLIRKSRNSVRKV